MSRQGSTAQRGYDKRHEQARRDALRAMPDGQPCHICGNPMRHEQALDLDHSDDRTTYLGLAHAACNRRAGGLKAGRIRRAARVARMAPPQW